MAINFEKIKTLVTGKSKEQRESESLAKDIARRQISKAQIEERARQMERVTRETERIKADAMIAKTKQRYSNSGGGIMGSILSGGKGQGYSSPFGGSSIVGGSPKSSTGSLNIMTGGFSAISPQKVIKNVRRRRVRPRKRARRIVYVRKYV